MKTKVPKERFAADGYSSGSHPLEPLAALPAEFKDALSEGDIFGTASVNVEKQGVVLGHLLQSIGDF